MSSEQLRDAIIRAAMALVGQHDTLTRTQIARAAGVGEADLLSVFDDVDAVVQATIGAVQAQIDEAFDPTDVLGELQRIPADQPLAVRLVGAVRALDSYHARTVSLLAALDVAGGVHPSALAPAGVAPTALPRRTFDGRGLLNASRTDVIRHAVTGLLAPAFWHRIGNACGFR